MDAEELRLLKLYMHVDHNDDDQLIIQLWHDAKVYLGLDVVPDGYWLAAAGLTLQWYDGTPMPDGVRQLVNQLKLKNPSF